MILIKGKVNTGNSREVVATATSFANDGTDVCILSRELEPEYVVKTAVKEMGLNPSAESQLTIGTIKGNVMDMLPKVSQNVIFLDGFYDELNFEDESKLKEFEHSTGKTLFVTVELAE